jgi:hypothetical protein
MENHVLFVIVETTCAQISGGFHHLYQLEEVSNSISSLHSTPYLNMFINIHEQYEWHKMKMNIELIHIRNVDNYSR